MRRLNRNEDGAVAVMAALLMVLVLGMAAIVIDIGMLYAERAQLQNGADAAALAIAQDCAVDGVCPALDAIAVSFAGANANDELSNATATRQGNTITVQTSTLTPDGDTSINHWFAPILGIESTDVGAIATAAWGSPKSGPSTFPLTFSVCQVRDQVDGALQLLVTHGDKADESCNYGPSGHVVSGNFGWLEQDAGVCGVYVNVENGTAEGRPGNSEPDSCDDLLNSWAADLTAGEKVTVILPVFEDTTGKGKTTYHLTAFAAFEVVGWKFSGGDDSPPMSFRNTADEVGDSLACTKNCRGIIGKFKKYVMLEDGYTMGPPDDFGITIVQLTK